MMVLENRNASVADAGKREMWVTFVHIIVKGKGKGHRATGRGRLRSRIFLTLVGRQPYAPAAFTPGEIPATHFRRLSRPQGTWFRREPRKNSPVTPPGIDLLASSVVP